MRRNNDEGRHLSAWMRGRGRDFQGNSGLVFRNDDLVLHLFNPECGRHLGRICVRVRCLGITLEEGDVGGSATHFGGCGARGDGEKGRLGDVLSVVGVTQHSIRIVQYVLGNRARRNEFAKVLRQSWRVHHGRGLAGKPNLGTGVADHKRSDGYRWDFWRACDAGGGR